MQVVGDVPDFVFDLAGGVSSSFWKTPNCKVQVVGDVPDFVFDLAGGVSSSFGETQIVKCK